MKSNKKLEQNASQIILCLLLDAEKRMKEQYGTDEYYRTKEKFNPELRLFISLSHNLADLTTFELLEVCRMVGAYHPLPLRSFFIYCSQALENVSVKSGG